MSVSLLQKWEKLGSEIYMPMIEAITESENNTAQMWPKALNITLAVFLILLRYILNDLVAWRARFILIPF